MLFYYAITHYLLLEGSEVDMLCLIGFGRIGETTAEFLRNEGLDPVIFDTSGEKIRHAEHLGYKAHLADASELSAAERIASTCDIAVTALPSITAEKVLRNLIEAGINIIVDVSYIRNPLSLHKIAIEKRVKLFVDAGLAPGLSNLLAARASSYMDKCNSINIYVGGIEHKKSLPLGLVASWSITDLLEEYTRKAQARINGKNVLLDPIKDAKRVNLPELGEFDALPTDGLRTLLKSLSNVDNLVEYTLRYSGHVDIIRFLKDLGLLDDKPYVVGGCSATPRDLLARLLEERLPRKNDRVILYVYARGYKSGKKTTVEYMLDESQEELKIDKPALTYLTGMMHSWFTITALKGEGHIGVNAPEEFYSKFENLLDFMRSNHVEVKKRICTFN